MTRKPRSALFSVLLLLAIRAAFPGSVTGEPRTVVSASGGGLEAEIFFEGSLPRVELVEWGTAVRADGCISGFELGAPDMPAYVLRLELPANMKVGDLSWRILESMPLAGTYELSLTPAPPSTDPAGRQPTVEIVQFDENDWFPASVIVPKGEDFFRGHRIAAFVVYPVQYRKASNEIRFLKRIGFSLELVPDDRLPLERGRATERSERELENVLRSLVVNAGSIGDASRPSVLSQDVLGVSEEESFSPTFKPSLEGSPVDYVIITDDVMSSEFQRLADWQTKSGVSTVVRTVSWIRDNYLDGCDVPETIRKFIQDAYANWGTVWVLLGGDSDVIPARYGWSTFTGGEYIPTDLYYQCLDRNWNADGDSYFGEGRVSALDPGDDADLYPEVWIGRAPVNTTDEAQLFVDKTLAYIKSPPAGLVSRTLFFAEVLFPKDYVPSGTACDVVAFDGAQIAETSSDFIPPSMTVTKLYQNNLCYPGTLPETKQAVIDSLNAGFGLAEHIGHGYRNTMSVGDGTLTNSEVDLLNNGSRFGVMMGENCTSAAFDFNCIGERFVLNENGGSVCYLGSTRYDYPTTAWDFHDERFRLLFEEGTTNLGKAMALSKVFFVPVSYFDDTYRWTQFVQILLGEPYLPLWTAEPETLLVTHDSQFEAGTDYFDVAVEAGGLPVDSALVCLWKLDECYRVAYTDPTGLARIAFTPDTEGSFSVTVTKQNYIPYEGSAEVVMPTGPYLYTYSEDLDDDADGLSFGNGDYRADAGETIELTVSIGNNGNSAASAVTAKIRTDDPMITLLDSTATFGDVAASSFLLPDAPFLLQISPDCPDARDVVCTIEARDGSDNVWTDVLLVRVHAPVMWHAAHAYFDTLLTGNRDGYIDPGEEIEMTVTLRNLGAGKAYRVVGRLSSPSTSVTIYDSLATFGSIQPCSSSTGDAFLFVVDSEELPVFYLTVTDTLGLSDVSVFELLAPEAPTDLYAAGSASSISLAWSPNSEGDLHGYNVYRSGSSSGPYFRVNEFLVERTSYYVDDGLAPYTKYYYRVSAQDSSANEVMSSSYVAATTNPPLHENAPFELGSELTPSSPAIVDIDKNGEIEIFTGSSKICAFKHNGDEYRDGDNDLTTLGVFAPDGQKYWCSPAIGDIDNDNEIEVVAVDWNGRNVYVWGPDGTVETGWPQKVGINPWSTPALGNITGGAELEIVVGNGDGKIYAWNADGTEVIDGDSDPSTFGVFKVTGSMYLYGSAALADIDSDDLDEVIVGGRDGLLYALNGDGTSVPHFPYVTTSYMTSSPAIADIDEDGQPEIVFASANYRVYVINTDSTLVPGWPKSGVNMGCDMQPSPAIGDLDGDGHLDVVIGACNGYVYAWTGRDGQAIPGWPVLSSVLGSQCSPTMGDMDGDGMLEVLFGAENGRLYAWNHDGTEASGFPIQMSGEVRGPALIWDIDNDGYTNVICQNWDGSLYIWDMDGAFDYSRAQYPWPMFRHDVGRTGVYTKPVLTAVELSGFAALPSEVGVMLEWYTNLDDPPGTQWNIYRKEAETHSVVGADGPVEATQGAGLLPDGYIKVNADPVVAAAPHYYRFGDLSAENGRWYSYMLGRIMLEGEMLLGPYAVFVPTSSVPRAPALSQNFPNPFHPRTTVGFNVPAGTADLAARTHVRICVFDVSGRLVRTLVDEPRVPGFYSVGWDATSGSGERVAGGVYFIKAKIGDYSMARKIVVLD